MPLFIARLDCLRFVSTKMAIQTILLTALMLVSADPAPHQGVISGIALNGTSNCSPLANAEVVLRAADQGSFVPIARTTTDLAGRFTIAGLPVDSNVLFLAGVNHQGVHYPGHRVQLRPTQAAVDIRLVAYDAVESPSPLVSDRHEIHVRPTPDYLEIQETLLIDNPSSTTYVGQASEDVAPVTLRLSLPDGLDKVTFEKEFHGRNFSLHDGVLETSIPFRPGRHEFKFSYRLPVNIRHVFVRQLDRPTNHVVVRVSTQDTRGIECNLAKISDTIGEEMIFEQRFLDHPLPTGYAIELKLGSLPISFSAYARWVAGGLLVVMILGTLYIIPSN